MPGQPVHSSCRITPASTDRMAAPIATPLPAPQMIALSDAPVLAAAPIRLSSVLVEPEYSPPPLFLINASFLI